VNANYIFEETLYFYLNTIHKHLVDILDFYIFIFFFLCYKFYTFFIFLQEVIYLIFINIIFTI